MEPLEKHDPYDGIVQPGKEPFDGLDPDSVFDPDSGFDSDTDPAVIAGVPVSNPQPRPLMVFDRPVHVVSQSMATISCAAALFLRDGIANVRMTDIAESAGVGVATIYRRFKTKTNLAIIAGTHMWNRFNVFIRFAVESDAFLAMSGAERLSMLFDAYVDAYVAHPDFIRFLDEFDHMVLAEGVEATELEAYGEAIDSFYLIFEDAYRLGRSDGSIANEVDFRVLYTTVAHAMMGIAQKLVRGDIIPSDDFSQGRYELECLVQMARCTLGISGTNTE